MAVKNVSIVKLIISNYCEWFNFYFVTIHFLFYNKIVAGVNFLYFCAANAVARLGIFQKYQDWDGRFEGVLNKKWQRIIDVQCHTVIR